MSFNKIIKLLNETLNNDYMEGRKGIHWKWKLCKVYISIVIQKYSHESQEAMQPLLDTVLLTQKGKMPDACSGYKCCSTFQKASADQIWSNIQL